MAKRHGRLALRLQVPHAGAFLTKICQLEEQTERVGNLICLPNTELVDQSTFGSQTDSVLMLAICCGEPANLIQMVKNQIPGLLANDAIQTFG
jgi:hypothetical protein